MTSIVDPNRATSKSDVGSPSYAPSIARQAMLAWPRGGEEPINRAVDLIQEIWQRRPIVDVVLGEIRANDLSADKIKAKAQLAPSAPFAFGFMLLDAPFALTEDLQASTVNDQVYWFAAPGLRLWAQRQPIALAR